MIERAHDPRVGGICECGLDFHYDLSPRDIPAKVVRVHCEAARETGLPLVVHTREADEVMGQILEEEYARGAFRILMHCYPSGAELARKAAAMGAVLLSGGTSGKRFALPHSRVMIHQPHGGMGGTALAMEIQVQEILKMKKQLEGIMAHHSGRSAEELSEACDRDNFMSPEEAKDFGLIDHIVARVEDAPDTSGDQ